MTSAAAVVIGLPGSETTQTTFYHTATAEPTAGDVIDVAEGAIDVDLSDGPAPGIVPGAGRIAIRCQSRCGGECPWEADHRGINREPDHAPTAAARVCRPPGMGRYWGVAASQGIPVTSSLQLNRPRFPIWLQRLWSCWRAWLKR